MSQSGSEKTGKTAERGSVHGHGKNAVGKVAANSNGKTVRKLASDSVKSSKMRNFFIIVTILLSVSLLMVMALFYSGMNTEKKRMFSKMQHVIYYKLDRAQLEELAKDERTEYVLGMKRGQNVEIGGKMVQPVAYDRKPTKDKGEGIETVAPIKGRAPEKINEAMLSDAHCKALGIEAEPGQDVSFTFLDGTTEEFAISGIFHLEGSTKLFSIILSQEYGERGSQLKDLTYDGIVRVKDAADMKQSEFLDTIRTLAGDYGIERKFVNENDYFLNTLSGGDMKRQENLLVIGVGIGILFVSVLVIYSVFYLAVVGRIRQFGQLRTIGMTKRQIKKMVYYEGMMLCGIGIPSGLIVGGAISYFIRPAGWDWKNVFIIGACVTAADIITVLLSIRKPAMTASSISPVEASKFSGIEGKKERRKGKKGEGTTSSGTSAESRKLYRKITPVSLAAMNRNRNKKKATLTMVSLGVGGVLYMLAAFFTTSTNLEEYSRQGSYRFGEFVVALSYNAKVTAEHGQTDIQKNNPLNEALIQQIEEIDGVEKVREYKDVELNWESHDEVGEESMSPFGRKESKKLSTMLKEGKIDYDAMLKNDSLLISFNEVHKEVFGWGYEVGDKVKLSWYDGKKEQEREFTVAGILDTDSYIKETNNTGMFILPEDMLNQMMLGMNINSQLVVKADRSKESQIEKQLDAIVKETPTLSLGTLREQEEESVSSFTILFSVMLGLSIFIVAFSILNMLNTLITNILTRRHEFAMMQSVGMTTKQLTRMIQTEGLMLAAGNLVITLIFGTAAGYGMIKIFEHFNVEYMHFNFPGWLFLGYAAFTAIVPVIVSAVMIWGFQKEALVDRLRQG